MLRGGPFHTLLRERVAEPLGLRHWAASRGQVPERRGLRFLARRRGHVPERDPVQQRLLRKLVRRDDDTLISAEQTEGVHRVYRFAGGEDGGPPTHLFRDGRLIPRAS